MSEATTTEPLTSSHRPPARCERFSSSGSGILCAIFVAACVLVTNPVAKMPFSDEFSYIKTALDFAQTGRILYNGWATAMLGWLIPWGALVIKIFGFSFTTMRLSMLPIDMAAVYLFHAILRRFGINAPNAVFGTLALALSPVFLSSAASFMTDIPGLLVIFVCLYMCLRAVSAGTDKAALIWLCSASILNVAGGTVRQIAWLGALVMVPSAAWFLRERRGMKIAGVLSWLFSVAGLLVCLHWFNRQPYSVPEHLIWAPVRPMTAAHLIAQFIKTFLCFFLVILPISAAWLPTVRRWNRTVWMRFAILMAVFISLAILAYAGGRIDTWVMPWLMYLLAEQSSLAPGMFGMTVAISLWIRLAISLFVIASAFIVVEQLLEPRYASPLSSDKPAPSWKSMVWILGPFSLSYLLLLAPRGAFDQIQDRYLIGLVPTAIVFLLRLYQERIKATLPLVSIITLTIFALYSIAGTHDFFAESRAQVKAIHMVEDSGVSRRSIQAGFPSDGWFQIEHGGDINEPRIQVPAGAYNPDPPIFKIIPEKCRDGFTKFAPAIFPTYFILFPAFKNPPNPLPQWCFTRANYPPIRYTTWLPPFRATLYVNQLRDRSH